MHIAYLIPFLSLLSGTFAGLIKRSDCGGGRTASDHKCCVWYDVLDDLQQDLFVREPCGKTVHESLRLAFHDAVGFSARLWDEGKFGGGGAETKDGSIIKYKDVELAFPGNKGLRTIVERQEIVGLAHDISFGDLIQFAAAVGITNCPGAPRLEFLAGRSKETQPSPEGLLPSAGSSVDVVSPVTIDIRERLLSVILQLLERHADVGFSAHELVDLLIAHTIGGQENVNPGTPNTPFDTTPQSFDTQFFIETLLNGTAPPNNGLHDGEAIPPLVGSFRLASDALLARDPRTACYWQSFATDQDRMRQRFRAVMSKLAVVGQKREDLVDCSEVIPDVQEVLKQPFLPAGKTMDNIEVACQESPFPTLTADPGRETAVHPEFLPVLNVTITE
ncbi:hypothetical protein V5O48_007735 [Marasmius crinis-equi]|uniref:Peroxidase n=1 Tax=Marasmius crinis-equi TaxID=585013 RepID=A0ABR3FFT3_9AGAR